MMREGLNPWNRVDWSVLLGLVLIGALIAWQWFTPGFFLAGGDNFVALRPLDTLHQLTSTWSNAAQGGSGSYLIAALPLHLIWMLGEQLQLATWTSQWLMFALLFAGMLTGAYQLVRHFLPHAHRPAAVVAALFYATNMTVMFNALFTTQLWTFALTPFLAVVLDRYLVSVVIDRAPFINSRIIWLAIVSLGLSVVATNPPGLAALLLLLVGIVAWRFLSNASYRRWQLFGALGLAGLCVSLVNLWWIVPFLAVIAGPASGGGGVAADVMSPVSWAFTSARTSFLNIVRFTTHSAWDDHSAFPQRAFYDTAWAAVALFGASLIALSAPLVLRRDHPAWRLTATVFLTAIGLVFLIKGLHEPFATANYWLYEHVPGFWLFRDPAAKFFPLLSFCFTLLIAVSLSAASARSIRQRGGTLFALAIVLAAHWPLISGQFIALGSASERTYRATVQLPNDWRELSTRLASRVSDGAILMTPQNRFYQVGYRWGYYGVDVLGEQLFGQPILKGSGTAVYFTNGAGLQTLVGQLFRAIKTSDHGASERLTDLLGVSDILVRRDLEIDASDPATLTADEVAAFFRANPTPFTELVNGNLSLFSRSANRTPLVSAVRSPLLGAGSLAALATLAERTPGDTEPFTLAAATQPTEQASQLVRSEIVDQRMVVRADEFNYDERGFTTTVTPPSAGQYQVFATVSDPQPGSSIVVAGQSLQLPTQRTSTWTPLGTSYLSETAALSDAPVRLRTAATNLVPPLSEARGPWEVVDGFADAPGKPEFSSTIITEEDRLVLRLEALHHLAGMRQRITGLEVGALYQLQFEHRHVSGDSAPGFAVEMLGERAHTTIGRTNLESDNQWRKHTVRFEATEAELYLWFYTEGFLGDASANDFRGIQLIEVPPLGIDGLLLEKIRTEEPVLPAPTVQATRETDARYRVQVAADAAPSWLLFRQSYHPWWELRDANTGELVGEHVTMNGYANGWFLPASNEDRELILEYRPQRWLRMAIWVGLGTLFALTAGALRARRQKH